MYLNKGKWAFKLVFEVLVSIEQVSYLEYLRDFFGVGKIYTNDTNATYRVSVIKDLMVLIAHFTEYPLISPKLLTYKVWAEVVLLVSTKQHMVPATFNYIASIYAGLGRGASKAVMLAFPSLTPITLPTYTVPVTVDTINP